MKIAKVVVQEKIKALLSLVDKARDTEGRFFSSKLEESAIGTIGLLNYLYAGKTSYEGQILNAKASFLRGGNLSSYAAPLIDTVKGVLSTLEFEVENDLIESIESQAKGEVLGDFTSLSKQLLEEGHKEAAAVLACGALEDTMKKFALKNGLEAYEQDLTGVINSLKSKGLIKGAQSGVVQSYVQLRNKAFHAQFDKIEIPEISSLISFIEQFLIANF